MTADTANLQREFPDYDVATLPAIPAGFEDTSWHNNSAPSFENRELRLSIWVDYADESLREFEGGQRFSVNCTDEEGAPLTDEPNLTTDDWSAVEAMIAAEGFALVLQEWLTEAELAEVRRRNAAEPEGSTVCHSHDFCDANMAMDEAFTRFLGREPRVMDVSDTEEGPDVAIWNLAWDWSKRDHLTAAKGALTPLEALAAEFSQWGAVQGIGPDEGDAEELLMVERTPEQRAWLQDFIARWEDAQDAEDK